MASADELALRAHIDHLMALEIILRRAVSCANTDGAVPGTTYGHDLHVMRYDITTRLSHYRAALRKLLKEKDIA